MTDYIPRKDRELRALGESFVPYLVANAGKWGLGAPQVAALTGSKTAFDTALDEHEEAHVIAKAKRVTKDIARKNRTTGFETLLRVLAQLIQNHPATTDGDRAALGITVPDRIPTRAATTESWPNAAIDNSQPFQQTIRFWDQGETAHRRKPKGVHGCQVWLKILPTGDPAPTGPDGFVYLFTAPKSPRAHTFKSADVGKRAYYMLRWEMKNGTLGPWGPTHSATITG